MQRYVNFIASTTSTSSTLMVLSNATCTVYVAGTSTAATLYSDNGITPLANPFLSSSTGQVSFYAANGLYDLVVSKIGYLTVTISAIELDDLLAPSGSNSVGYLPAGTGAVATTVQTKLRETVSIKDFGAVGDGVADDTAAIQAAITAVQTAGGGVVLFPTGTYKTTSTITLLSTVFLSGYGATISWSGGASSVITTSTSGVTLTAGMEGLTVNGATTATTILALYSTYHCSFRDLTLKSTSTTNICLDLQVNTTGTTNADSNRNNVFNQFENILQDGTCGTALRLKGNATNTTVVTLNTFIQFQARSAAIRGIDFSEWCDNNSFSGTTRVSLPSSASGAIGVEWNSANPTVNVGVYSNNFEMLAVDTFGVGSGRVGLKMNSTKLNKLAYFFQEPVAEGGSLVVSSFCYGYDITQALGGTNFMARKILGENYGIGGSWSASYSVWSNSFTLSGTGPAGFRTSDTFASDAVGAAGIIVANKTQAAAFTLGSYWGILLSDIVKGAGSAVTFNVGISIQDRTAGTNNWGIELKVTTGANKFNIYASGTAPSYFAGPIQVAGAAAPILTTVATVTSGAGASAGTLNNSPVAGNPTKWIPFSDAGVTRYIPAW